MAKLTIKINYEGTQFFTNVDGGYYTQHNSLEEAYDWLIYNGYRDFETETKVIFSE